MKNTTHTRDRMMLALVLTLIVLAAAALVRPALGQSAERFVPTAGGAAATVELRNEAVVRGEAVALRSVLRWPDGDRATMESLGDLVIGRFGDQAFLTLSLEQIKATLREAGANLAMISFSGATTCTVSRSDTDFDEGKALRQWLAAKDAAAEAPATRPAGPLVSTTTRPSDLPRSLREILVADAAARLSLPVEALEVRFGAQDDRLLRLVESHFRFGIEPRRVRDLGDIAWDVTVWSGDTKQKAIVSAYARAWQDQVVVARPVAHKQVLREEDVICRRTLVDQLPGEPLAAHDAVVGQQAARDLAAGVVVTGRMIEATPLVRRGQLISVLVDSGKVQIKTVAEAREIGVYGQTIRVRKPGTQEEFNVVVSGPQQARLTVPAVAAAH